MAPAAAFDAAHARSIIEAKKALPGAALPILHDLQHAFGYIDDAAVAMIAEALNQSRAEVLGVVTFYHDFRRKPARGRVLKLCRAESCQALGCEDLVAHLAERHGLEPDREDDDRALRVETVYCLGNCALSPAALFEGEPVGRLDRDAIDRLVARAEARA